MRTAYLTTLPVAALLALAACDEGYLLYDTDQADSVFFNYVNSNEEADSAVTYSFGFETTRRHVVDIPVALMGMPRGASRVVALRVVADSTTMTEGVNFAIERHELAANAIADTVKVALLRDGDPEIQTATKRLRIEIVANDDLRPTGRRFFDISYNDIRPATAPSWWLSWAPLPTYTFENAQLFFEYFYRLAPAANRELFREIVERYGDYFVNATSNQGPLTRYDAFITRYVLIPMYDDTQDQVTWPFGRPRVNY